MKVLYASALKLFSIFFVVFWGNNSNSAQQYDGLCSYVKMEIHQELSLERVGFLATLELTNNEGDAALTDFSALLTFEQTVIGEDGEPEVIDVSDKFFVQPPVVRGTSSVDGGGVIEPGETAIVEWFIIPKTNAGGKTPIGTQYDIGADLGGALYDKPLTSEILAVIPDTITVLPDPELEITYFQPRDVDGDDPFTPEVEQPVPFTLGVLVNNKGYGTARNMLISSEQPKIVEDPQGLLVVPKLLSARVNDVPLSGTPTLTLDLGDIPPSQCRKGAWDMITTLAGEFTEFKASYTHSDALGGESTSIIKSINAYFIVHEVLNDLPGRDKYLDFLATTDKDQVDLIPDALYESDCGVQPVNSLSDITVASQQANSVNLDVTADFDNWVFMRIIDPKEAKYPITSITRSDGKVLNPNNYWTNTRYEDPSNKELNYLNILDFVVLGNYKYHIEYALPENDDVAPKTSLQFSGNYQTVDGTSYIDPATQMFFTVEDVNTASTYYRLTPNAEFKPAYPFTVREAGSYQLEFYSIDAGENIEAVKTANIVVIDDYPEINVSMGGDQEILSAGEIVSVRDTHANYSWDVASEAGGLTAKIEVYEGVYAWPTLAGIPSSPTQSTDTVLTVAGARVEFYQYKLNAGSWSQEYSIEMPIQLNELTGDIHLLVRGRNSRGTYQEGDLGVLQARWQVSENAPDTTILTPETPAKKRDFTIPVDGVTYYRYNIDNSYFRAEASEESIVVNNLYIGTHSLEVDGSDESGSWKNIPDKTVRVEWLIDRNYGTDYEDSKRVYEKDLGKIGSSFEFSWDGRLASGVTASYGWYTLKLIITDRLGRQTIESKLVQVGDMLPDKELLVGNDSARNKGVYAHGRWAVWQDQVLGAWNIYGKNIFDPGAGTLQFTNGNLNSINPKTDGDYIVWQTRRADGNWDVQARKLDSENSNIQITETTGFDEINPVVEFPWVVFQRRANNDSDGAWQLIVKSLTTNTEYEVDSSDQDQLDPMLRDQKLVWQDWRDVGSGEIYFKDLATNDVKRITQQSGGQYHPVIEGHWVVWTDNRNTQLDLYGYNLLNNTEYQLTDTPEDESRPNIYGDWIIFEEDSAGEQKINLRLLSLPMKKVVQLTNEVSNKEKPVLISGTALWTEISGTQSQIHLGIMPNLVPVFDDSNMITVTENLVEQVKSASHLLSLWQQQAGVTTITRYNQFLPQVITDTVSWEDGIVGEDFALTAGDFLWVEFNGQQILDLAGGGCSDLSLKKGINVLNNVCVPSQYSAYKLVTSIGKDNVNAIRTYDAKSGRWDTVTVYEGNIAGENFDVTINTVLLLDLKNEVSDWLP